MNAIQLLKRDERSLDALFKEFESTKGKARRRIVDEIVKELSVHIQIEEMLFYPFVRKNMKEEEPRILKALEENHILKWTLSELDGMPASAERFEAKMMVLIDSMRRHMKEEETGLFLKLTKKVPARTLNELGAQMERLKKIAPTHPHPRAPDTPPANKMAALGAGALDRARDAAGRLLKSVANRRAAGKAPPPKMPPPKMPPAKKPAPVKVVRGKSKSASAR